MQIDTDVQKVLSLYNESEKKPKNYFTKEDIDFIKQGILEAGKAYGWTEYKSEQTPDQEHEGISIKSPDGLILDATYYPSVPGFGERWGIYLFDKQFEELDYIEPHRYETYKFWTNERIIEKVIKMLHTSLTEIDEGKKVETTANGQLQAKDLYAFLQKPTVEEDMIILIPDDRPNQAGYRAARKVEVVQVTDKQWSIQLD